MKIHVGVNTYPVRHLLQEREYETYRMLRETGFDFVEPLAAAAWSQEGFPKFLIFEERLPAVAQLCRTLGFPVRSIHVAYRGEDGQELADYLGRVHTVTGATVFIMGPMIKTQEEAEKLAKLMSSVQAKIKGQGLQLLYHNHREELTPIVVDGKHTTVLEHLLDKCTEQILLELDIGWVGAVTDEIGFVNRLKKKIHILHLKDLSQDYHCPVEEEVPDSQFVSIGSGKIQTETILQMLPSMPNFSGMVVIDQDASGKDILEDLKNGLAWVRSVIGCMPQ